MRLLHACNQPYLWRYVGHIYFDTIKYLMWSTVHTSRKFKYIYKQLILISYFICYGITERQGTDVKSLNWINWFCSTTKKDVCLYDSNHDESSHCKGRKITGCHDSIKRNTYHNSIVFFMVVNSHIVCIFSNVVTPA